VAAGGIEIVPEGGRASSPDCIDPRRGFRWVHHSARTSRATAPCRWRILARADRLFVKQFEEETNLRAMILMDASRSMEWRGAPDRLTKREYAERLAAALGLILLRQRDATGLITFDDTVREVVPARVKAGQWRRLVRGIIATPEGRGTAASSAAHRCSSVADWCCCFDLLLGGLTLALRYLRGHQVACTSWIRGRKRKPRWFRDRVR
jgi:hypothetical protein